MEGQSWTIVGGVVGGIVVEVVGVVAVAVVVLRRRTRDSSVRPRFGQ